MYNGYMKNKCIPLFDRVLVEIVVEEKKQSKTGLILPEEKNTDVVQGRIIAVGLGRWNEDGDERIPLSVEIGDIVLFSRYGFDEVTVDEKKYVIGREDQLLAVINKKK
jgi:chaperonin GroES